MFNPRGPFSGERKFLEDPSWWTLFLSSSFVWFAGGVPGIMLGGACVAVAGYLATQRARWLGSRPIGRAWLSELARDSAQVVLGYLFLLSAALGPWVMQWAACTPSSGGACLMLEPVTVSSVRGTFLLSLLW